MYRNEKGLHPDALLIAESRNRSRQSGDGLARIKEGSMQFGSGYEVDIENGMLFPGHLCAVSCVARRRPGVRLGASAEARFG